jgi:large repetitive protein
MKAGIITAVITVLILAGGIYLISEQGRPVEASEEIHKLASCLTEKDVKMYGAYTCPYCKEQRAMFGDAVEKMQYVECTKESKTCVDMNIESYPTWVFPDGTRSLGMQPLATIAQKAGCEYTE